MCSYSGGVATIEVQGARMADTGVYTIHAVNELGEHETSSKVVVEGKFWSDLYEISSQVVVEDNFVSDSYEISSLVI